jgi:hypothetical protein
MNQVTIKHSFFQLEVIHILYIYIQRQGKVKGLLHYLVVNNGIVNNIRNNSFMHLGVGRGQSKRIPPKKKVHSFNFLWSKGRFNISTEGSV